MNPVPDLTAETKPWERVLARVSHFLLYALIFAMPLTGWMMSSARNFPVSWFKLFQFPDLVAPSDRTFQLMNDLHHLLFSVLVTVALLHVAGALKHHFIDRNDVLKRMLPFGRVK
jgi:cytochrome b561